MLIIISDVGKKCKKKILVPIFVVFMLVLSLTPVYAAPPTRLPILNKLTKYHRVNLLRPYPPDPLQDIGVPIGDTTFVTHGWVTGGELIIDPDTGEPVLFPTWSEMTGKQKKEFLKTANFELSFDGTTIELQRFQWYDARSDGMYV
jgi:hypothetical protein